MKVIAVLGFLLLMGTTSFAQQGASGSFALSSSAFSSGGEIPDQYTCKGADSSPALEWSGAPAKTQSFALIMDDPDAPAGTWVHWVLWNLPPTAHSLPEGVPKREVLDGGARQGHNSFKKVGYNGPCPPGGATHHYYFRLYALNTNLNVGGKASRNDLEAAMKGHVLAQTEYMGTFHR